MRNIKLTYADNYEVTLDGLLHADEASIPTFYKVVERFQDHFQLRKAGSQGSSHTSFATLQEEVDPSIETPIESSRANRLPPKCLYDQLHFFSQCQEIILLSCGSWRFGQSSRVT
jgi:hypothetical protein